MGTVVKIAKNSKPEETLKSLDKLAEKILKKPHQTLADFYSKMPDVYGDGLTYQKKLRSEWQYDLAIQNCNFA